MTGCEAGRPHERLTVIELDGHAHVYDPEQLQVFSFNASASAVWFLLDGQRTVEQVIELLQREFSESPDVIAAQTKVALQMFSDNGLLEEAGAVPSAGDSGTPEKRS